MTDFLTISYETLELERLEILDRSPDVAWVVVRPSRDASGSGTIRKLEIDVCDQQGRVCVRMVGFSSRAIAGELESPAAASATMLLSPRWEVQPLPETAMRSTSIAVLFVATPLSVTAAGAGEFHLPRRAHRRSVA